MNIHLSFKDLFQWAFALSPFPSYLPQYFSIMQQLALSADTTTNDDDGPMSSSPDNGTTAITEQRCMSIDRGGDIHHLRKRNLHDSQTSMHAILATTNPPPNSDGAFGLSLAGTPSKSFEQIGSSNQNGTPSKSFEKNGSSNQNNGSSSEETDCSNNKLSTGLSRATVLLLLSAHLIRLLYFHGLILEEQSSMPLVPPIASAGVVLDELLLPPTTTDVLPPLKTSALQWDLLGQSISMIAVQLLLLHSMMLLRRKQRKRQRKRMSNGGGRMVGQHESTGSLSSVASTLPESPRSDSFIVPSSPPQGTNHNSHNHNSHNNSSNDHNNMRSTSFWQTKRRQLSRNTTAHFHNLLSPHNILQKHSFLEYLELLILSSMAVKLVFDYHWYPMYRMQVVEGLKHTSIGMESCLALPQIIRNYRNKTTEGLSLVMVGGWVAGDFFKLCYFLFSMIGSDDDDVTEGGTSNNVFALGCLLSISLDSIVMIQMAWWYPQREALQWQQRIMRSVRHWKANKDDDAGESLLIDNAQMKAGLFASLLRTVFQWKRGIRPRSNSS